MFTGSMCSDATMKDARTLTKTSEKSEQTYLITQNRQKLFIKGGIDMGMFVGEEDPVPYDPETYDDSSMII
jgi:hypothetical protein